MNTATSSLSFFIFAVILLRRLSPTGAATCHPDDESGLLAFKSGITRDPSGLLKTWTKGTDCCKWFGITCRSGARVNSLSLSGEFDAVAAAGFSGTFSPALAKLQHLDSIYFSYLRNLTGKFPEFLFRLPALDIVYIDHNGLSGSIPANVGALSRLFVFSFEGNRFTGPIPSSISNLTQLGQLKLGGNRLTGNLPLGLANLKSLSYLAVDGNRLSGNIPDFFKSFTDLNILNLSRNAFSGKIPPSIASLAPKLRYLELGHNNLSGTIPEYLGNFKSLDTLDLSWNRFTGTVPKSFSNLTKIFNLDLSHNLLIDPFPVMNVKGIESLDLSYNQFHLKSIPKWVTSSPIIYSLKLAKCGIKMRFDDWKPAETYFYDFIDLSENEITGSPANFLNQTEYLKEFRASGNKLSFDLGKIKFAKTLKTLDLSRNSVFGKVPATVAGLQTLNVSYNHLCGKLPATKFPASSFAGNDCLCGSPLPPCKA
ncbi:PREDICTED: probable leucine-rich repeat receptor-like protein kinase At1g35710 [Tarenaya hassleriana]|uniref:probable leucine-rich repeat receptor-like protein kinase At1g35710 n=1 Tax=Tarenaya hassleriana TaxID=28532 RepID=UPI00053C5573|nr:PREDICTED: probable leucine-rich repeat receptor-like protein kinase At1g35710 [Tarenaya hassleriana]